MNIRPITPADAPQAGHTLYQAFCGIADQHNFPHDFASAEVALQMAQLCIGNPNLVGFVAQGDNGEVLGLNFLWRQNTICGVGPIAVAPNTQSRGVGRALMRAVIEAGCDAPGIRLVQDAFNTASLSLYASEGFEVVEPLVVLHGTPLGQTLSPGTEVRPLEANDYGACNELHTRVHGFSRGVEVEQFAPMFQGYVALRKNRVVAYATSPNFWQVNHAVAENLADLQDLLVGASLLSKAPLSFLLPTRQAELFRWCLNQKMRVIKPMNLMKRGEYQEPRGWFLPSVTY